MKILITGAAGFIGSALTRKLIDEGHSVIGIDNYNEYYDAKLKRDRVAAIIPDTSVEEGNFGDRAFLTKLFNEHSFDVVCHLGAMAGVRYSVECPDVYIENNLTHLITLLEVMKEFECKRMVFASSSSVYGNDTKAPFTEDSSASSPESVYGATKRAGELILHSYFSQYGIESTSLRFFTVYGPWSRPDMAMLKFAQKMVKGESIDVYNNGELRRDFTYIDDIVAGFVSAVERPLGYEICNLGGGQPVDLMKYIELLEETLEVEANKNLLPMQQGDVFETYADTSKASKLLNFSAQIQIEEGIIRFSKWFKDYYNV